MIKLKYEVMAKEYNELIERMEREYKRKNLPEEGYVVWNKFKADTSKIIENVNEAIENKKVVSLETLLNWKNSIDSSKKYLIDNLPKCLEPGDLGTAYVCGGMNVLLNLMSVRMKDYLNTAKAENGVDCSRLYIVEDKIPENNYYNYKFSWSHLKTYEIEVENKTEPVAEEKNAEKNVIESKNELEATKEELKVLEESLAVTNESILTKQSKQFKEFRKCVKTLNKAMAECKNGVISEETAKKIALSIVLLKAAKLKYDNHCIKHPQSDITRAQRREFVGEVMSQVEKLEKISKVSGNMKEAVDTVAKMKAEEPVKNIYLSTGETKEEFVKKLKDAEMEKEKKEAKMLAKKLAATIAEEKSVKNLDLANGMSRAEYLADLKKAEEDKDKKLKKAVKATKAKAKKNLTEEKNLFLGESPIFASEKEIAKFGNKEVKPAAKKIVAQPKNDAAQPTNTASQPEGPSMNI